MSVKLIFEGIRCFTTKQEAVLRPLTLLVGENSSGKSTFLALCRIARAIAESVDSQVPFNEPPFLLGAYDQIAAFRGGRRAKSFSIGLEVDSDPSGSRSAHATFVPHDGQPILRDWRVCVGPTEMRIEDRSSGRWTLYLKGSRGEVKQDFVDARPIVRSIEV